MNPTHRERRNAISRPLNTADELDYARTLGRQIAATRQGAALTQTEFAERIGVGRNTIWRWETGRGLPDAYQLSLIKQIEATSQRRAKETL
jgi:DNA-binding transcriptional regulator YiaG